MSFCAQSTEILSKAYKTLTTRTASAVLITDGRCGDANAEQQENITINNESGSGGGIDHHEEVFVADMTRMSRDLYTPDTRFELDRATVFGEFARRSLTTTMNHHQATSGFGFREFAASSQQPQQQHQSQQQRRFRSFSIARKNSEPSNQPFLSFKTWMLPRNNTNKNEKSSKQQQQQPQTGILINRLDEAPTTRRWTQTTSTISSQPQQQQPPIIQAPLMEPLPMVGTTIVPSLSSSSLSMSTGDDHHHLHLNHHQQENDRRQLSGRGSFQQAAAALVIGQFGSLRLQKESQRNMFNETQL